MWFIILLVLALSAFFIVKAVKAQALRKQAEQDRLAEGSGLAGTLNHEGHDEQASAGLEHGSANAQAIVEGAGESQASTANIASGAASTASSAVANATDHAADVASKAVSAAGEAASAISGKGTAAVAAAAGAVAAGGAAAVAAAGAENASASAAGNLASMDTQVVSTGDPLHDIQEMIKILNLAEPDAGRLAISREEFSAIRHGNAGQMPSSESLSAVADKLQHMLA